MNVSDKTLPPSGKTWHCMPSGVSLTSASVGAGSPFITNPTEATSSIALLARVAFLLYPSQRGTTA